MLIVCDLDGTLSDCRPRQHLAASGDWDSFHAGLGEDNVHLMVLETLRAFLNLRFPNLRADLIFLTGRPEDVREETQKWLQDQCDFDEGDDYLELLMRPKDDWRKDVDLKAALLEDYLSDLHTRPDQSEILILEDREAVVAMWRDAGYACFQTAQGAF